MRTSTDRKSIACPKCKIPMQWQSTQQLNVAGHKVAVDMFYCGDCRRWHAEAIGESD
jgi:uncharacterized protein YbaR (Trm112 family)